MKKGRGESLTVRGRQLARSETAAGVGDLIAAAKRKQESRVAAAAGGWFGQQIGESVRDQVLYSFSSGLRE